ncbi:MAG: class I SAM-dependent methyltransferase [Rhodobacteraceae bacterium]|nr:class I SAM-dependent methyltransferase [Paracoccaceae bacterium]
MGQSRLDLRDKRYFFGSRARFLYELIGWQFRNAHHLRFMNYGYDGPHAAGLPPLDPDDAQERYCVSLYHAVAAQTDLSGARILDVGSGRGGGLRFVHRHHGPEISIGLDLAVQAVRFCNRLYRDTKGLTFLHGDATALPFAAAEFDAVLNVESAHCYPDRPAFFANVARVLKPGGTFLHADFTAAGSPPDTELQKTETELRAAGFRDITFADITDGIVRGLDRDSDRRHREIGKRFPLGTRKLAALWAGTQGSWIYEDFRTGRRRYFMCRASTKARSAIKRRPDPQRKPELCPLPSLH